MARTQLVVGFVLIVAVAVAVAVAAASRGGGSGKQTKPARPAVTSGLGDDDANVMRRLQRDKLARSHK